MTGGTIARYHLAIVELRRDSAELMANPVYPLDMRGVEIDKDSLKSRREALRWSQSRLAAELGTDQNTVSRWELGKIAISNPRMLHLAMLQLEQSAK